MLQLDLVAYSAATGKCDSAFDFNSLTRMHGGCIKGERWRRRQATNSAVIDISLVDFVLGFTDICSNGAAAFRIIHAASKAVIGKEGNLHLGR